MNKLKSAYICDIETNGLLETLTKLHVFSLCYKSESNNNWEIISTSSERDIKKVMENPNNIVVGHNFFLFDTSALKKLYPDLKIKARIIDTLLLSWYLRPNRIKHGLESYGEDYGVPKPEINDWEGLTYEEYKKRCEEDVKINTNLWYEMLKELAFLYNDDWDQIDSFINFLMCKGEVYHMQQHNPLRLDVENAKEYNKILEALQKEKEDALIKVMPKTQRISKRSKPKKMYKSNGKLTALGEKWFKLLDMYDLPPDYDGEVEHVTSLEDPNPNSVQQIKDWLFSLGWEPEIFSESFSKVTGEVNQVPQIKDKEKNLCKSVLKLAEKEPAILQYEDIGIIAHRNGYLKGFLKNHVDGNIVADMGGLTNTLRVKHRGLVNLPSPSSNYGQYVRSVLLPPEGHIMIGSDLSSLENTTRNNFVYKYDPEFVEAQSHKYYDPHLDIAVISGLMSEDHSNFYKWWKAYQKDKNVECSEIDPNWHWIDGDEAYNEKLFHDLNLVRQKAKTVSYSALYGVGAPKLSKELKCSVKEAKSLLDAYWKINWSVKHFASRCKTKTIKDQMWVLNPLNNYWYSLRNEKDIFSTVNQGAGDYIFTLWEKFLMMDGLIIRGGWHDELVTTCRPEDCDKTIAKLYSAIDKVNEVLQLQIPVGIDYKVGNSYADVH